MLDFLRELRLAIVLALAWVAGFTLAVLIGAYIIGADSPLR